MKKYYEINSSGIIKGINNMKNEYTNDIHVKNRIKNIQIDLKNNEIKSNTKKEHRYNYLHQTSSSLYKVRKSKTLKKNETDKNYKNMILNKEYHPEKDSNKLLLDKVNLNMNKTQRRIKSLLDKENINIICHKNICKEKSNKNIQNQTQNYYNYFPQPEPFPKTINYNFSINNNLKYKNDISTSKEEENYRLSTSSKKEDNTILYLLTNLNLGNLYNIFISNYISFNDLFLLKKEDFIEMKIPIGPRNRIIHFISEYKKFGKTFDFKELSNFLNYYKKLMEKPIVSDINFNESIYYKDNIDEKEEKFNNYNDEQNEKSSLLFFEKPNKSEKKLIVNQKEYNKNNNIIKKYNSVNYLGKNNIHKNYNKKINSNNIKSKYADEKKTIFSNRNKKNNSSKNRFINNDKSKIKKNYDLLYKKFNVMNKKVNDFQQNYSKIQKYSKYIDEKISEFFKTQKIT